MHVALSGQQRRRRSLTEEPTLSLLESRGIVGGCRGIVYRGSRRQDRKGFVSTCSGLIPSSINLGAVLEKTKRRGGIRCRGRRRRLFRGQVRMQVHIYIYLGRWPACLLARSIYFVVLSLTERESVRVSPSAYSKGVPPVSK